jgi:phosphatidylserine decarboxylase
VVSAAGGALVYGVDMSLAVQPNPDAYRSFNEFFIRAIKPERRPICVDAQAIVSPADGVISQMGTLREGQLLQAKGIDYSLSALLGGDEAAAQSLLGGEFMTIYLSPKDYHRVHMPFAGTLERMLYVPGRLFSVNAFSTANIPNLFARNERVVCWFNTEFGPMVVILVGAMLVASIHTVWAGQVAPKRPAGVVTTPASSEPVNLNKGEELGHFELGSTAIVLFPANVVRWNTQLQSESAVQMGQEIGVV